MCVYKGLFIWRRVTWLTELLALSGKSPSIENYRFPGEMFTWRKRVTRLSEFPVERGGNALPGKLGKPGGTFANSACVCAARLRYFM